MDEKMPNDKKSQENMKKMDSDHSKHKAPNQRKEMDMNHMKHKSPDKRADENVRTNDLEMNNMEMNHMDHGNHNKTMNHSHMTHGGMGDMDIGDLRKRFWISLILTIPIIVLSPMMGINLPFQITFPGSYWLVLAIGTVIYFYGGQPFFTGSKSELKNKKPAMMTLITMGITVAYFYSLYSVFANNIFHVQPMVTDFFWELATLIDIMLLGHILEMGSIMSAGSALDKLAKLLPKKAHKIKGEQITDVDLRDLQEKDLVEVRAGEKIPGDGKVVKGETSVNESMVTGESKQITKNINDNVIGGSVNGEGTIEIEITGVGESSYLSQVQKLVSDAQKEQSQRETIADLIARALVYVAITLGLISFVSWYFIANISIAFSIAVTILVIACPHALGLAIPLVVARSTSIGAKNGLLFRNRIAFEQVKELKYALMDKTGTLTEGNFKVTKYKSLKEGLDDDKILSISASLEKGSSHPLAIGILSKAAEKNISYKKSESTRQITGMGLIGIINENIENSENNENNEINEITEITENNENYDSYTNKKEFKLVSEKYLEKEKIKHDKSEAKKFAERGNSISYLLNENNDLLGFIAQGDEIKAESENMINSLKNKNISPVMLTGDNQETANLVAQKLGITDVHGKLLPKDKEELVKQYQKSGKVMMIGDGVNDAPSLALADIGVAIGSGTDVAIDSADIILVKSNPNDIIKFLELGQRTTKKMNENLVWGAGYNVIALPLAAGILAPFGFLLNPMIGAILMSLSTIIVAINAMFLRE